MRRAAFLVVEEGKLLITAEQIEKIRRREIVWSDLIQSGVVDTLDAEEEENAYIALKEDDLPPEHTHMEISPASILGITASLIPFPEHNQSPRNTYEAGICKASFGHFLHELPPPP